MILDFQHDPESARYTIVDAKTGEPLPSTLAVVRADDEAGTLTCLMRGADGAYIEAYADDPHRPVTEEDHQRLRDTPEGEEPPVRTCLAHWVIHRAIRFELKTE